MFYRLFNLLIILSILPLGEIPIFAQKIEAEHDVIIVGGGLSGLTAAYYLQDFDVKVLERAYQIGGLALTQTFHTFQYESGTDGEEQSPLSQMIDGMGLDIRQVPSPFHSYFYSNQFYDGEDGLAAMLIAQSSLEEFNRFGTTVQSIYKQYRDIPHFDFQSSLAELDNIKAAQWFADNQFSPVYSDRYHVICRRYFSANLSEVSALSLLAKIGEEFVDFQPVEIVDSLNPLLPLEQDETNAYVFADNDATIDKISTYFGDAIHVFANVVEVTKAGNRYHVVYEDQEKQQHMESARAVILAVPAFIATRLAPSILTDEQVELLEQIPYRSYMTLQLYSELPIFDRTFDFSAPNDLLFTDVYDDLWVQRNTDPDFATEMNSVTVIAAPPSFNDEEFFNFENEEVLLDRLYQEMNLMFPGIREKVLGYVTYNLSEIDPIMPVGGYHRLERLHETFQSGLILSGDYMIYPDFEGMVNSGYQAAQDVREFLKQGSGIFLFDAYR